MATQRGKEPGFIYGDVPLGPMTTFGIGGPARWLARPGNRGELSEAVEMAREMGLPVLTLGGGSNLLVADSGVDAMVVRLDAESDFSRIEYDPDDDLVWRVGAAAPLASLVSATAEAGVSGIEMLAGIPGRVGGAVAMNAGAWSGSIGDHVIEAEVFDFETDTYRVAGARELSFAYRRSGLSDLVGLRFTFGFPGKAESETVAGRVREYRERKKAAQPLGKPSAGCVFKNPPGDSAGSLLDQAGCKAMREGSAEVSQLHANFIVNQGGARAAEVALLAVRMREAVWRKFEVALEPEMILWGEGWEFDALRAPVR